MSNQDNVYKQLEAGTEAIMGTEGGDVVAVENEGLRLAYAWFLENQGHIRRS